MPQPARNKTLATTTLLRKALLFPAMAVVYDLATPLTYVFLRVMLGVTLLSHGLPKLLGTAHGSMADPMAGSIQLIEHVMHLPAAPVFAWLVTLLESVGGLLLALGFGTRLIAGLFAVEMLGIAYALGPTWPWIDRGIEYPVMLFALSLHLALRGGGRYSFDRIISREL